jgi:hypothetical protein
MNYILRLLSQPSSYAGLAAIALSVGVSNDLYQHVAAVAAATFGLVAFLVNEKKPK